MCSAESKPNVKPEVAESDDDVVEILPRSAVAPNGGGFSVKIRDTHDGGFELPTTEPTTAAKFTMKVVPTTGGWEINIEDTSTLTTTHLRSVIDVIASRERELRGGQQHQQCVPSSRVLRALEFRLDASRRRVNRKYDPNASKRPLGAFFLFLSDRRDQLTLPGMRVTEVTKAAGVAWGARSNEEKQGWHARAAEEKQRYDREYAEYQKRPRNL